jgi:hypothetical protein
MLARLPFVAIRASTFLPLRLEQSRTGGIGAARGHWLVVLLRLRGDGRRHQNWRVAQNGPRVSRETPTSSSALDGAGAGRGGAVVMGCGEDAGRRTVALGAAGERSRLWPERGVRHSGARQAGAGFAVCGAAGRARRVRDLGCAAQRGASGGCGICRVRRGGARRAVAGLGRAARWWCRAESPGCRTVGDGSAGGARREGGCAAAVARCGDVARCCRGERSAVVLARNISGDTPSGEDRPVDDAVSTRSVGRRFHVKQTGGSASTAQASRIGLGTERASDDRATMASAVPRSYRSVGCGPACRLRVSRETGRCGFARLVRLRGREGIASAVLAAARSRGSA